MRRKTSNIISIGAIIFAIIYLVFIVNKRNGIESNLVKNGKFRTALIIKSFIGKTSTRHFTYKYKFKNKYFDENLNVSVAFFKRHKIGDTIIIKILPNNPEESMIVEDKKYKPCYGVAPEDGWEELPVCE